MNDLNTQQIILLTLLVSFVTSIATGITTVSLLEQAPEPVTQTINRVVERTVERVVEIDEKTNEPQEKIIETVVVKEEDLTVEAVEKNSQSLVRIFQKNGDLENFVSLGMVISNTGDILTSSVGLDQDLEYIAVYPDSTKVDLNFKNFGQSFSILAIPEQSTSTPAFGQVTIGNSQKLKLGQSVIALSGQNSNIVTTGIVTSIESQNIELNEQDVNAETIPQEEFSVIDTSVDPSKIVKGAMLLNLKGELVGFKNSLVIDSTSFTPSSVISTFLSTTNQIAE